MIIIDLDNCISDDSWRLNRIGRHVNPWFRYHDYHLLAGFDELRNQHLFAGRAASDVIILTARPNFYRAITECWLSKNGVPYRFVIMRNDGDNRPSASIKLEQIESLMANTELHDTPPGKLEMVYDDRMDVIIACHQAGIPAKCVFIEDRWTKIGEGNGMTVSTMPGDRYNLWQEN